jgi:hypothetical protein
MQNAKCRIADETFSVWSVKSGVVDSTKNNAQSIKL